MLQHVHSLLVVVLEVLCVLSEMLLPILLAIAFLVTGVTSCLVIPVSLTE